MAPSGASASKLPAFADSAWEAMGGGPPDLFFPEEFLGTWEVTSVLLKVETPLGEEAVPNMESVQRAAREDLNRPQRYRVTFMANPRNGKVIFDRRFNTASMLEMYYGDTVNFDRRIDWNPADPNVLTLSMPGGMNVRTRVTRRSEEFPMDDRIETSEYVESVYESGNGGAPRVKASQCFTKYKWRERGLAAKDGGPVIVATQVVSDFLTAFDGEERYLKALNKAYAQYTYRIAFAPAQPAVAATAAAATAAS